MATPEKWPEAADYESDVVVNLPGAGLNGRIQRSCGTEIASSHDYYAEARVPSGPWGELTPKDRSILLKGYSPERRARTIRIVRPPDFIFDSFEELRTIADAKGFDGVLQSVSAKTPAQSLRHFAECARDLYGLGLSGNAGVLGGVRVNPAGLRTVTTHPTQGRFVGMHVDNWSMVPLRSRHLAPIRICLNIGSEPRYFLFVGLTIQRIADTVRGLPGFRSTLGCTDIGRLFLSHCPSYAVFRLKLMPGEAYIAPTEAIIHDGSTESAVAPDLSLSIRENMYGPIPR
ncbi:MAG: hypothetical protein QM649_15995 [Silvibacterium sp.]